MYNAKYGKLKYGLKEGATKIIKISADLSENTWSIAGIGESIQLSYECNERVLSSSNINNATLIEDELTERLLCESKIGTCYSILAELNESVDVDANVVKEIFLVFELSDSVKNTCYLGKNISVIQEVKDGFSGSLFIGKVIQIDSLLADQVDADISANVLEKQIAYLDVVIPPGGELRIDSSLFNATLNGENILHLYNGDWIFISRDTTNLAIQTATGGKLKGKLLFTERYL